MSMRLKAALRGDLKGYMRRQTVAAERAVTGGVTEAANTLKARMRAQVRGAGLGARLANTWRAAVYPKGKPSLNAAGMVWTKAPRIMEGFEEGSLIRARDGLWLAIPTPAAPKRVLGKRVTPHRLEQAWGIRLHFVYRNPPPSLLVAEMRARTGQRGGFTRPSERSRRTGTGLATVILFWLVPQAQLPKLINFDAEAKRAQASLPRLILKHWRDPKV